MDIRGFQETVWDYYRQHGRDLPWRTPKPDGSFDPYKILVSEVMLQQTQVNRVIQKYREFLNVFPDASSLARAPLSRVLIAWSGLGYNRRAKYLHEAAKQLVRISRPWTIDDLVACKGIGHNTAAAVVTYAYNLPVVFIETNIRTVFIHHFFSDRTEISDQEILPLIEKALLVGEGKEQPDRRIYSATGAMRKTVGLSHCREWYWALMDYGSMLKRTIGNASRMSKHYTRQSTFEGSLRQIRGQVLRHLGENSYTQEELSQLVSDDRLSAALDTLLAEGLISTRRGRIYLG